MKKAMVVVMAVAVVIVMAGGAYAATVSQTVNVTGTVASLCKAGTVGSMGFTISDPSAAGPIAATVTTDASVFCTNSWPFTVTAASTNHGGAAASCATAGGGITGTLNNGSGGTMNYTFTCGTAAGTGQGFGAGKDQKLSIGGSIAQAAYINAPASALYTDTVTLTITY